MKLPSVKHLTWSIIIKERSCARPIRVVFRLASDLVDWRCVLRRSFASVEFAFDRSTFFDLVLGGIIEFGFAFSTSAFSTILLLILACALCDSLSNTACLVHAPT